MPKKQELLDQIESLKVQVKKEEEKEVKSAHIPETQKELAERLHKTLCRHNHTDGCDWFYDDGSWTESSRKNYLRKAGFLLGRFDEEQCAFIVSVLDSSK